MKTVEPKIIEEGAEERAAVELSAELNFALDVKNTRAKVIAAVKNCRTIPLRHQEVILAEIAVVADVHEVLWLTVYRHPHKSGCNFSFTIVEI